MNDKKRSRWIDNDQGLYNWWKQTRLSKNKFIKQNRAAITVAINNVLNGTKQAHYLAYEA